MSNQLTLKSLLEAGAHFGHQTHKWNPKMKPYVFGERNGIYILDLSKTIPLAKTAYEFLKKTSAEGRPVLFVGTKKQTSDVVKKAAESAGAFYVTNRWLGGMLTNFKTIALSIDKLRKIEKMKESGDFGRLTKKERLYIDKEIAKLEKNIGGIKDMRKIPGAVFVIDPSSEKIAILEARKLNIPVVAITDTNCDPEGIDYVVPGNDDALKSVTIFTDYFANAVAEGNSIAAKTNNSAKPDRDMGLEREMVSRFENDIDLVGEEETEESATEE
jgi:small subunit ribosomal protein S2